MLAKNIMQLLWTSGGCWDDPPPLDIAQKWSTFVMDLENIVNITIPRSIVIFPTQPLCNGTYTDFLMLQKPVMQLSLYTLCLYDNTVQVSQVIAKTRDAPLQRVTLPRLELCAAHLLARLVNYCFNQMSHAHKFESIVLWCDFTVALAWLMTPSYRLKTFVANRVAQTQELVSPHCWRYIPSADNPADHLPRYPPISTGGSSPLVARS